MSGYPYIVVWVAFKNGSIRLTTARTAKSYVIKDITNSYIGEGWSDLVKDGWEVRKMHMTLAPPNKTQKRPRIPILRKLEELQRA